MKNSFRISSRRYLHRVYKIVLKLIRKIKIQTRLIGSFFILTFLPLIIVSYMTFKHSSEDMENKITSYSLQVISEMSRNLKTQLKHTQSLCEELMMIDEIQKSLPLYDVTTDVFEKYQIEDLLTLKFTEKMRLSSFNASSNLTSINIMPDEDTIIGVGQNNYDPIQFNEIFHLLKPEDHEYHYKVIMDLNGDFEIVIYSNVTNHESGELIGVLILTFKENYISDICRELYIGEKADVFILDQQGVVISSSDTRKIQKGTLYPVGTLRTKINETYANSGNIKSFLLDIWGKKNLVIFDKMEDQGWNIVGTIPYQYIQAESNKLLVNIIKIGLICLVVSILFAFVISTSISVPLNRLKNLMNSAKRGKLNVTLLDYNQDEISEMGSSFNDMMESIRTLMAENVETQKEIAYKLGEAIELRSRETGNHIKRVAYYSRLLAIKFGFSEDEADMIKIAATLHDIGKISIPDKILLKPGRLTPDEFESMKRHTRVGYNILSNSNKALLKIASIIALEHHERYDGKGYPDGITGDQINVYSKIVTLSDVFDALGTERVYKKKWEFDEIIKYIREERGKQFDPVMVDLFLENLDEIKAIQEALRD